MGRESTELRHELGRLQEIAAILIRYGFGDMVRRMGLGGLLQEWLGNQLGMSTLWQVVFGMLRWVIILSGLILGFALIYYLAPNRKQQFVLITSGNLAAAALLVLSSLIFARYVQTFWDYSATYGSVGAVIVLMLWLYMAGFSMLIGAELNAWRHAGTSA